MIQFLGGDLMDESILDSVKKLLGVAICNTDFDQDIIIHINSVLFILSQMGIVKTDDFEVVDQSKSWREILTSDQYNLFAVKSWVGLKVRMLFDPPTSSILAEAIAANLKELEWRIYITENYIGEIESVWSK